MDLTTLNGKVAELNERLGALEGQVAQLSVPRPVEEVSQTNGTLAPVESKGFFESINPMNLLSNKGGSRRKSRRSKKSKRSRR